MNDDDLFRSWKVRGAPAGFSSRVTAPRQKPWRWIAVAAGLLAFVLAGHVLRPDVKGSHESAVRTTLAIADRATVVAEAHTKLSWVVEQPSGISAVEQASGAAFYRVDEGGVFTVSTPYGIIDVRGTCFGVEVKDMKAAAVSAGISAIITGAVFVTVYEGRVALGKDTERVEIAAGERAYLTPGQAPKIVTQHSTQAPPEALQIANKEIQTLRRELETVRRELTIVQAKAGSSVAAAATEPGVKPPALETFRPSPAQLQTMAKRCEIKIDLPGGLFNRQAPQVGKRWSETYGLNEEELAAMRRALGSMHADVQKSIREQYVLLTGDAEAAKWLSPQAMFEEMDDKAGEAVLALARQRISAERAGLAVAPSPNEISPGERYMRWFAGLPDVFEQKLAKELSPERAKALRDKFDGWQGSRHSMDGCPQ